VFGLLRIEQVKKRFGERDVVKGVSFHVKKGEAFGLLGPNGAGKSTTISMICGLIPVDDGDVIVGEHSIKRKPQEVKRKIGVVPQDIALYPTLSAQENLMFWGRMYGLTGTDLKKRTAEVLEMVGLSDRAKDQVGTFSGGMKRRINIGAALLHNPEVLIMDEPTVGIDPQSRNHILETVKMLNESGMTVLYTSHYMEEVEYLCDRVAIMDHGEVIAMGNITELCNRLGRAGETIEVKVDAICDGLAQALETIRNVRKVAENRNDHTLTIFADDSRMILGHLVQTIAAKGMHIHSIDVRKANLESVFLELTGRSLRD
jgi:ABC-2 type transport system ATP-binding protein